jgi:hypothetical protein
MRVFETICGKIAAAMTIAYLFDACSGCSRVSETHGAAQSAPVARETAVAAASKRVLPPCPTAPAPMLPTSAHTGHHKVFLSWKASSSSGRPDDPTLGYCLYRSETPGMAKNCPKYPSCEQVNVVPVSSTHCVDELVKDHTTYYYGAITINSAGKTSTTSEEAIAEVPIAGKQNPSPPDAASYPACRAPAGPSQEPR